MLFLASGILSSLVLLWRNRGGRWRRREGDASGGGGSLYELIDDERSQRSL